MKRRLIIEHSREDHRAWLYSVVFSGKVPIVAVFLLFTSFLVQPFHQAMAAEEGEVEPEAEETVAEPVKEQVEEEVVEEVIEETEDEAEDPEESVEEEVTEDEDIETETSEEDVEDTEDADSEQTNEEESEESTEEEIQDENEDTASSTDEVTEEDIASSTDDVVEDEQDGETATSTEETTDTDEESGSGGSSGGGSGSSSEDSEEDVESDDSDSEESSDNDNTGDTSDQNEEDVVESEEEDEQVATSTEESVEDTPVVEAEIIISEDNFYQFSRQSCVAVGDGTYHCSSNEVEEYDNQSVVYSELGESGNLEIFLETAEGDVRQVTDNEYDDASPYYDAETLQIVWQRLIDGRYQIIMYDIAEDEESQLTFSRTNNMEPKISVDGVVWQAWDNNDWEIMYFDGRFTDQITDNNIQDVTPVIQDSYILWTVIGKGEQEGKVYSLDSKELLTISGYDGGVIENPRFVLVYDTKFDNGDVITQGFDPATGISEPISAKPAPEPIDIPTPDPIGEIRALIQNKSTFEDDLEKKLIHTDDNSGSSTDTTSDTLDLKGDEGELDIASSTEAADEVFELTEFDLILTETEINFDELDEIDEIIENDPETEGNSEEVSSTQ